MFMSKISLHVGPCSGVGKSPVQSFLDNLLRTSILATCNPCHQGQKRYARAPIYNLANHSLIHLSPFAISADEVA